MSGNLHLANAQLVLTDRLITGAVKLEQAVITNIAEGAGMADGAKHAGRQYDRHRISTKFVCPVQPMYQSLLLQYNGTHQTAA